MQRDCQPSDKNIGPISDNLADFTPNTTVTSILLNRLNAMDPEKLIENTVRLLRHTGTGASISNELRTNILNFARNAMHTDVQSLDNHTPATSVDAVLETALVSDLEVSDNLTGKELVALESSKWSLCHPAIMPEFKKLLLETGGFNRSEELHVIPIGNPFTAKLIMQANYPPLRSSERHYGTAAEPGNPCMRMARHKLNLPSTHEAMGQSIFWMEEFFERLDVPDRETTTRKDKQPYHALDDELKRAHERFRGKLWQLTTAATAVLWGQAPIDSYKRTVKHISLSIGSSVLKSSSDFLFLEMDQKGEIRRIAMPSWHTEYWIKARKRTIRPGLEARVADLQWNFAAIIAGVPVQRNFIASIIDQSLEVPEGQQDWNIYGDNPQRCAIAMRSFERQNQVDLGSEVPTFLVDYYKNVHGFTPNPKKPIISQYVGVVENNWAHQKAMAAKGIEMQRALGSAGFAHLKTNAGNAGKVGGEKRLTTAIAKWKAAYDTDMITGTASTNVTAGITGLFRTARAHGDERVSLVYARLAEQNIDSSTLDQCLSRANNRSIHKPTPSRAKPT
jgi:hypothetical protein